MSDLTEASREMTTAYRSLVSTLLAKGSEPVAKIRAWDRVHLACDAVDDALTAEQVEQANTEPESPPRH